MINWKSTKEFGQKDCALLRVKNRWLKSVVLLEAVYLIFSLILYFQSINNLMYYHC